MTKLLERAVQAARRLPPDAQDEVARAVLSLIGDEERAEEIDPAHLSDVLQGLAEAKRREFAGDEQVEATFRRFGP